MGFVVVVVVVFVLELLVVVVVVVAATLCCSCTLISSNEMSPVCKGLTFKIESRPTSSMYFKVVDSR